MYGKSIKFYVYCYTGKILRRKVFVFIFLQSLQAGWITSRQIEAAV